MLVCGNMGDAARGVTDYTKGGKCSGCGECCSDMLPMSDEELARIKRYVREHGIKEKRHIVMRGLDFTCPLRDDAKRVCTIYDVRPEICRAFRCDMTPEAISKNKALFHATRRPVSMRNEIYGNSENVEALGKAMAWMAEVIG